MATIEDLAERVERLLVRHEELRRTNELLARELASTSDERDQLRSRLNAARSRIDLLLQRLPSEAAPAAAAIVADGDGARQGVIGDASGRALAQRRMKQIEVTILGTSYILGCPEGGETSLLSAVADVDREMSAIRDSGKVKARERIAVLAALNLAFALAERPAAVIAEDRAAASRPAPGDPGGVDVDSLVRRLDAALGADGRLL